MQDGEMARIEGGRKGKRLRWSWCDGVWHQKRQWKTRWRMFGSTGVNGGCRSAGTEFLGTALATMETSSTVCKVRRSDAKETRRRGDARNTNRAGLAANPLTLQVSKENRETTGARIAVPAGTTIGVSTQQCSHCRERVWPCKVPDSACSCACTCALCAEARPGSAISGGRVLYLH